MTRSHAARCGFLIYRKIMEAGMQEEQEEMIKTGKPEKEDHRALKTE